MSKDDSSSKSCQILGKVEWYGVYPTRPSLFLLKVRILGYQWG